MSNEQKVGLVGLGAMGQGVAKNLLKAGFILYGCDVRRECLEEFASIGGIACDNPSKLGMECDVIITLVVNARQTEAVLFGPDGAATAMRRGSAVIASATIPPAAAYSLGKRLEEQGIWMLDAPVTGGTAGAASGTLTLLTSGPRSAYEVCDEILEAISSKVYRFGEEYGLGSKVKLINQLLVGVHLATAAEAVAFCLREGVDPHMLYDVITHSAGNSWAFTDRVPHILAGEYMPGTALDIFVKDLGLVLDAARDSCFPLPLASTAYQLFASASAAGLGREDDTAVIKTYPGITLPNKAQA